MNSMTMEFRVNNQALVRVENQRVVEDSANYLYAHFTFTEDWNGTTKYAIVDNKRIGLRYKVPLDANDTCKIPSALIKYDGFGILVVGEDTREFVVITTSMIFVQVLRTNYQAAEEPDIKFITSDTLDIEKDGDAVVIEIPNIYVTDASLQNDSLEVYGRDGLLLKSVPLPYGRVNNITLQIDNNTFALELKGFDKEGNLLFTRTADFAIEGMLVTGIAYDSATKEVVVSYKNGTQARASIAPILSGYATEKWVRDNFYNKSQIDASLATKQNKITNENKLSSDLVEDANSQAHKFVSQQEKTQITTNKNAISGIKDGASINSFSQAEAALALKADKATTYTKTEVDGLLNGKQDTLSGSDSIDITSNVVSVKQSYVDSQFLNDTEMQALIEEVFS